MLMRSGLRDLTNNLEKPFDVIAEFSALSPRRKVLLCDNLFTEGRQAFYSSVELLWPSATANDCRRLEKFLFSLKNRSH